MNNPVPYIDGLARKNSEALSFIPRPMLEHYARVGQILIAREEGEPCGYLIHGNGQRMCRIYQACIQYDARRRENGMQLIRELIAKADREGFEGISLWCADDLEANSFWASAGFVFSGQRQGGARRGRVHNLWVLTIAPSLFAPNAAEGNGVAARADGLQQHQPSERGVTE